MENIIRNQEGIEKGRHGKKEWKKPVLIILSIDRTDNNEGVAGDALGEES